MNAPIPTPPTLLHAVPIATSDQFREALISVRDRVGITATDLGILRAFCAARAHTLTALKLAQAIGLRSWNEANLRLGTLARRVAEALRFTPEARRDQTLRWWQALAFTFGEGEDETGHFEWTLRPELVSALRTMRWA